MDRRLIVWQMQFANVFLIEKLVVQMCIYSSFTQSFGISSLTSSHIPSIPAVGVELKFHMPTERRAGSRIIFPGHKESAIGRLSLHRQPYWFAISLSSTESAF